jgi:hypothetical protein
VAARAAPEHILDLADHFDLGVLWAVGCLRVARDKVVSLTGPSTTKSSPTPVSPPPTTTTPTRAQQVPQITSVGTYTQGELVYFDIGYPDPGNDA